MRGTTYKSTLLASFMFILVAGTTMAQSSASKDYLQDCAIVVPATRINMKLASSVLL